MKEAFLTLIALHYVLGNLIAARSEPVAAAAGPALKHQAVTSSVSATSDEVLWRHLLRHFWQGLGHSRDDLSIAFIVRTYHGRRFEFMELHESLEMFLPRFPERIVVLDAESRADKRWSTSLLSLGYKVFFERKPEHIRFRSGDDSCWPSDNKNYNRSGHHRQQWSSFYFDRYTTADIIGVLDSDTRLYSLITADMVFDQAGRLLVRGIRGDRYEGSSVAFKQEPAKVDVDVSYSDVFPMFFWRDTFALTRSHLEKLWRLPFDNVFEKVSAYPYSYQNILYRYALTHQRQSYELRVNTDLAKPTLSFGSHRGVLDIDIMVGCCRCFGVLCDCPRSKEQGRFSVLLLSRELILRYSPMHEPTVWEHKTRIADGYYKNLSKHLSRVDESSYARMKGACRRAKARICAGAHAIA
eukprot:TRINITY_DN91062_c0_g1_i2.p1 TRINITY_DN91062_c0_g1~~TRINITY_DN91062_c0_g1_i2.p1  ORF type:complete len:411 (-),score=26.99 TRINITY_DN91062_c0_g1_i2:100-1332(-)